MTVEVAPGCMKNFPTTFLAPEGAPALAAASWLRLPVDFSGVGRLSPGTGRPLLTESEVECRVETAAV